MSEEKTRTEENNVNSKEVPLKLTFERAVKMGCHVMRTFDDPYYAGVGAQIAYYFFMASVPALIVLIQVLGLFDVSLDFILEWMQKHMDAHMSSFVTGLFTQSSSVVLTNVIMIVLTLWGASGLEFSLSRVETQILTDGRYRYSFFNERVKSFPMAVFIIIMIAAALLAYVYGWWALTKLVKNEEVLSLLNLLKGPVLFIFFFIIVSFVYIALPRIRVPYIALIPGAVLSTIGMVVVTALYSSYVGRTMSYDILYGSFANIVALLLWFFLISWVLCIGMVFNRSWDIYMARGRLHPSKIKAAIRESHGNSKNFNMYYTANPARFDRRTDTVADRISRKLIKDYADARDYCVDIYDNAPDRERDSQ